MGLVKKVLKWLLIGFGAFMLLGFILTLTDSGEPEPSPAAEIVEATYSPTPSPSPSPVASPSPSPSKSPKPSKSKAPSPSPTRSDDECDPSYPDVCIPPVSVAGDLDCGEIAYTDIRVLPPDPHDLDGDGDGYACTS